MDNRPIAVVGLGYVGLPLARAFGGKRSTIGFDIDDTRISDLKQGKDVNGEFSESELLSSSFLSITSDPERLREAGCFIITVPTPIDEQNQPDLSLAIRATELVSRLMTKGTIVIYESTVYPGCTEEVFMPILEEITGMVVNTDFFVGYSPERMNPGDQQKKVTSIVKLTSGSNREAAKLVDDLYSEIVSAGTFQVSSIRVAEAAKVIENTQRDVNIALVNELATIFRTMGIDSNEVFEAARTKWNFVDFRPGLVGGHCIPVDPYYLAYKATMIGHNPTLLIAGRQMNERMPDYIAEEFVSLIEKKFESASGTKVLIFGLAYKENVRDTRDTKVVNLVRALGRFGVRCHVLDPQVDKQIARNILGEAEFSNSLEELSERDFSGAIIAVAHEEFKQYSPSIVRKFMNPSAIIFDLKRLFPRDQVDGSL